MYHALSSGLWFAFSTKWEGDKDGFDPEQCSCHPEYVGYGLNLV